MEYWGIMLRLRISCNGYACLLMQTIDHFRPYLAWSYKINIYLSADQCHARGHSYAITGKSLCAESVDKGEQIDLETSSTSFSFGRFAVKASRL